MWKKDSFMSTQWLTKRVLSTGQISQVTLKTNLAVHWGGTTSQWLITGLVAVGEMASVELDSSNLVIWSTRKWHAFLLHSNKINQNLASYYCCTIMPKISMLIASLEIFVTLEEPFVKICLQIQWIMWLKSKIILRIVCHWFLTTNICGK